MSDTAHRRRHLDRAGRRRQAGQHRRRASAARSTASLAGSRSSPRPGRQRRRSRARSGAPSRARCGGAESVSARAMAASCQRRRRDRRIGQRLEHAGSVAGRLPQMAAVTHDNAASRRRWGAEHPLDERRVHRPGLAAVPAEYRRQPAVPMVVHVHGGPGSGHAACVSPASKPIR